MHKKLTNAFTLIELLVVIAIIGLLATIILVSLSSARVKGRDANRVANLQEMAKAINLYDSDPPKGFYTAVNGASVCPAHTDVTGCLGVGASGASANDTFANYKDPSNSAAGPCTNSSSGCQYSISSRAGGGNPTTQDYEICAYLESPSISGTIGPGLVRVDSQSGSSVVSGCN